MDKITTSTASENEVLHFENQSKLSAAEIAKALAHHNHNHPETPQQDPSTKPKSANKAASVVSKVTRMRWIPDGT